MGPETRVTELLTRVKEGERGAWDELMQLLYDELRRAARMRLAGERQDHTLSATALVHESYVRLIQQRQIHAGNRGEFMAAASRTMRRVLIDYARTRKRQKRGGGAHEVPIEEAEALLSEPEADEVLAIERALEALANLNPRATRVIECRIFGGLSLVETAQALGVSAKTVQRDWLVGRAWLRKEVAPVRGRALIDATET